ncbi:LysR family transcriptional regulator [Prosthecomicrobium pneumaticum]|uniref:DNA-binding transcriptional LysR family regulator n=1 Tax=Prosthecomicrobium pneumaticum TaxID=81895 RepID=A0A7W9FPQ3_9HYPH|nr:LysR family transcriptional regulator [Prosthecomicrobium pneumaticum]MBB5754496.1 DNA-binding transcriptional LysR family regulator [Prosthecomicrobium pneumaticum]
MRVDDLDGLQLFAVVARHLNFRRAAHQLGLSAPALSERIRALEARLGVRLFNRTTRSVALTEAGRALLDAVGPALAAIGDAVAAVGAHSAAPKGTLRINAPRPALEHRLMPYVLGFLAEQPEMRVEVVADESFVDIVGAGFDAGVRYGEHLDQDMIAVPLGGPQRFRIVGAPAYFAAHGRPQTPADLARHRCFNHIFPRGNLAAWLLERDGRAVTLDPRGGPFATTEPAAARAACLAGLGLWFTFEDYVLEDLAAARLETTLDAWSEPFPGPYLYYPERRLMPAGLRAFVDFVRG